MGSRDVDLNEDLIYPLQKQADQAGTQITAAEVSRVVSLLSRHLAELDEEQALSLYLALRRNGRRLNEAENSGCSE